MDSCCGENKKGDRKVVAEKLLSFFPLFDQRFMRPIRRQTILELGPMQMHTIFILKNKGTVTRTELANELDISKQQLTPIINKLEKSGLIERENNPDNRRLVQLKLSAKGSSTMLQLKKETFQMLMEKLELLDDGEITQLENTLGELYRLLFKLP